jgi:hypothetical protein
MYVCERYMHVLRMLTHACAMRARQREVYVCMYVCVCVCVCVCACVYEVCRGEILIDRLDVDIDTDV